MKNLKSYEHFELVNQNTGIAYSKFLQSGSFLTKLSKVLILLFFILMFLFPHASFQGASSGLLLWFLNVLPTLLPFIIISNLMIRFNIAGQISRFLYPLIGRLFRVSQDGCYPILMGFLSGIPMGAKSTADLVSEKKVSREEGGFLLSMCNNASAIFIMSYIAINQLQLPRIKYVLFAIIYGSSIISAVIYRYFRRKMSKKNTAVKDTLRLVNPEHQGKPNSVSFSFDLLDGSIMNGFEVVTKIGGYIILFSILAQIVNVIVSGDSFFKALFMGLLEITTGVNQVCNLRMNIDIKIVLTAVLASFGGLSGMAQTKSVLGDSGLSIKSYFIVKLLNAVITFLLTCTYVSLFRK